MLGLDFSTLRPGSANYTLGSSDVHFSYIHSDQRTCQAFQRYIRSTSVPFSRFIFSFYCNVCSLIHA